MGAYIHFGHFYPYTKLQIKGGTRKFTLKFNVNLILKIKINLKLIKFNFN